MDLEGEKAASAFLISIGVDFSQWPYNWKNPLLGTNRAIFDDNNVRIISIDQVQLDNKKQLVEGSQTAVKFWDGMNFYSVAPFIYQYYPEY